MTKDNLAYYERRVREEAAAAASATSAEAASAHRLLAIEYEAQAGELRSRSGAAAAPSNTAEQTPAGGSTKAGSRPKLSIR